MLSLLYLLSDEDYQDHKNLVSRDGILMPTRDTFLALLVAAFDGVKLCIHEHALACRQTFYFAVTQVPRHSFL